MSDGIKITSLELENVKRVRAVRLEPAASGLTVIGGDNCQGKTSILDGLCYALGGEKFRPSNLQREGGAATARIEVTLSNGLKVERTGKNATLKVTDPTGTKGGQRLLDSFIEELALDLPKFLAMSGKDKAGVLLRILGIGDQLAALDREERMAYDERTTQGRLADQKTKYAAEMPEHHDAPDAPVSAAELVAEAQAVMAENAKRANQRASLANLRRSVDEAGRDVTKATARIAELERMLADAKGEAAKLNNLLWQLQDSLKKAQETPITDDQSTADIERRMSELEITNAKVRANLDKRKALEDAEEAKREYDRLTVKVDDVRARRAALLNGAAMPLAGLSVDAGELTYNGKGWDCMSGAEQIRAGVAIVRKLKPACGFVLLDGLEQFDRGQLAELGAWLEGEGLQAIATRVSRGDECSIIIEDGMAAGQAAETTNRAMLTGAPPADLDY